MRGIGLQSLRGLFIQIMKTSNLRLVPFFKQDIYLHLDFTVFMKSIIRNPAIPLVVLLIACTSQTGSKRISKDEFNEILTQIAKGWNDGNARIAADVFAADAVYEEPPKKQYYRGQAAIFEFFGGEKGFDRPMKMTWHHVAFNQEAQIGFGEYTFAMNKQYHGIVVIKVENGKIALWREYQYESSLDWNTFSGEDDSSTSTKRKDTSNQ